ncbi:PIN domain-like protein [Phanerochaete sordida]|uniref:PIN domain-like protein n=1 Tax=Phanerochaete sordida TaxID=48140 RepID=A0A9P3LJM3_9APHY|nr:PIN domain-like protein [Phanerochaete sordida]
MGVPGLWQLLQHALRPERRKLEDIAVEGCRRGQEQKLKSYRVGIDASIWMASGTKAFTYAHENKGEEPELELRALFYHLCRLSKLPLVAVFVFDGPGRPGIQRKTQVSPNDHVLAQKLINLFGYEHRTAPGEAEADLANMSKIGLVDAIITENSDALIFGARVVLRIPPQECDTGGNAKSKEADDEVVDQYDYLHCNPDPCPSQSALFLMAIMSGEDFANGLDKATIAHGLAKYNLHRTLLDLLELPNPRRNLALSKWRADLRRILHSDPRNHLGRRYPTLSKSIPETFPDLAVARAYAPPRTSLSPFPARLLRALSEYPRPIDVGAIARLCKDKSLFGTRTKIVATLEANLWPSVVFRHMVRDEIGPIPYHQTPPTQASDVYSIKPANKRDVETGKRRVVFTKAGHFTKLALDALGDEDGDCGPKGDGPSGSGQGRDGPAGDGDPAGGDLGHGGDTAVRRSADATAASGDPASTKPPVICMSASLVHTVFPLLDQVHTDGHAAGTDAGSASPGLDEPRLYNLADHPSPPWASLTSMEDVYVTSNDEDDGTNWKLAGSSSPSQSKRARQPSAGPSTTSHPQRQRRRLSDVRPTGTPTTLLNGRRPTSATGSVIDLTVNSPAPEALAHMADDPGVEGAPQMVPGDANNIVDLTNTPVVVPASVRGTVVDLTI